MYRFSFKVRHKNCAETGLSLAFPKHHITVVDIQSTGSKKQYFYYITGKGDGFDAVLDYLQKSKTFILAKEIERSLNTLLLLVVIKQDKNYVQDIIHKYNGFFIDLHTVYEGYEYWHIGLLEKKNIISLKKELSKMGIIKTLFIGEVEFAPSLLSKQQKKVLTYAYEQGYYELPRKTTIAKIAKSLKLNPATVGEHLLRAGNKIIASVVKKI